MHRLLQSPSRLFLVGTVFVVHLGWYALLPFFALLLGTREGLSPGAIGLILSSQSFLSVAGSAVGGPIADRMGRRLTMLTGLVLRGLGIAGLGLSGALPVLILAAGVAGFGNGLLSPVVKAALASTAEPGEAEVLFSWRGMAASLGVSLGPVLGALLARGPIIVLFGAAGALHLVTALWGRFAFAESPGAPAAVRPQLGALLHDRRFLDFTALLVLLWALYAQLSLGIPLWAERVLHLGRGIGLIWTVAALFVVLCQSLVTRQVIHERGPARSLALGALCLGVGLGAVGLTRGAPSLLLAVLVVKLGEMLVMPTVDTITASLAPPGQLGSYYSGTSLAWGLGEGLGSLAGGQIFALGLAQGRPALLWWIALSTGALLALLFRGTYPTWLESVKRAKERL
ncbi:MAG TPA: MFS transporter [Symbiobacteriaceae bacterium]|nr:MFS transporter [Symbiobacteriaceae bacterium]